MLAHVLSNTIAALLGASLAAPPWAPDLSPTFFITLLGAANREGCRIVQMVFFGVVAALSAASGLGVVLSRRPLYSALSLVVNMVSLALLFLLLQAQFLAAVQLIVYAGAVMVLFVFVITLLNPARDERPVRELVQAIAALVIGLGLTAVAALTLLAGKNLSIILNPAQAVAGEFGSIQAVGISLYRNFAFPFEVTSVLLVVAAVGAIYLSRGR